MIMRKLFRIFHYYIEDKISSKSKSSSSNTNHRHHPHRAIKKQLHQAMESGPLETTGSLVDSFPALSTMHVSRVAHQGSPGIVPHEFLF